MILSLRLCTFVVSSNRDRGGGGSSGVDTGENDSSNYDYSNYEYISCLPLLWAVTCAQTHFLLCRNFSLKKAIFSIVVQSPLVIVYLVIVEFSVKVDRLCRPIVYFSMYFSRNSGITRYSGQIRQMDESSIHYYERRLYFFTSPLAVKV